MAWTWEEVKAEGCVTVHTLNGPNVLCRYWGDSKPSDANLILAAPEMLEALRLINDWWEHGDSGDYPDDEVRAAISKATEPAR